MSTKVATKVRIKPKGGKNADAIEVFPVDAKEAISAGTHEYVGKDLGGAEWLEGKNSGKGFSKKKKGQDVDNSEDEDSEEDEGEELDIDNMNSKELDAFVKENKIKIKGFDSLSLAKKREALTEALSEEGEEQADEEI
ncbi:hypothetical protein EKK58_10275 [Candidatus Dependentiae bacterium]|nr:MAG: hypothetical protein EKK58_10275 [Candidatus Dependentiae bacterium]